jgi:hypothetical protein
MSFLKANPQRAGETDAEYSTRLDTEWAKTAEAKGLARLNELRALRDNLRGTRFEADTRRFITEKHGADALGKLDALDRAETVREQTGREQTAANLAAARAAAAADLHTAASTKHVSQMSDAELGEFRRMHGLSSRY